MRWGVATVCGVLLALLLVGQAPTFAQSRGAAAAGAEKRVALIIGNANYAVGRLNNPLNDVRGMAQTLRNLGFDARVHEDADLTTMRRAVADFGERLSKGGVGLFYYSGHGMQVSGKNFLIPLGADIKSDRYITVETVDVDGVLAQMDAAKSALNIVILDACRDNPFARRFRSASRGLAFMDAPVGTYIAYSTSPGSVAEDGEPGQYGVYTGELLRVLPQSGLSIEQVFKRVRQAVLARTDGRQSPWDASSLTGDFYFRPAAGAAPAPTTTPAPAPTIAAVPPPAPRPQRPPTETPQTPSARRTIKVATQSPLSGGQALLGQAIKLGTHLAIEEHGAELNAKGYQVELVAFDDEAKPAVGIVNAEAIVRDSAVLLVIGHLNSGVAIRASDVYRRASLAMISPANTNPDVTDRGYPNVSRVIGRDDLQGSAAAQFAGTQLRAATAYVIDDGTPYGVGTARSFQKAAEQFDIRIVGTSQLLRDNARGLAQQLHGLAPDVIYVGGLFDDVAPLLREARALGVQSKVLGPDGFDSADFARMAGAAARGVYYVTGTAPAQSLPNGREFVKRFERRFGLKPQPFAAEAYDATLIGLRAIAAAIDAAGTPPTRERVTQAVRRTSAHDGITGIIEFDARGDRKAASYFVLEVVGDRPEQWGSNRIVSRITVAR